jgi:hypothetical protein
VTHYEQAVEQLEQAERVTGAERIALVHAVLALVDEHSGVVEELAALRREVHELRKLRCVAVRRLANA